MKCTLCGKSIALVPSAEERSKKYGESPEFYRNLFTEHAECTLAKRFADTVALMRKLAAAQAYASAQPPR